MENQTTHDNNKINTTTLHEPIQIDNQISDDLIKLPKNIQNITTVANLIDHMESNQGNTLNIFGLIGEADDTVQLLNQGYKHFLNLLELKDDDPSKLIDVFNKLKQNYYDAWNIISNNQVLVEAFDNAANEVIEDYGGVEKDKVEGILKNVKLWLMFVTKFVLYLLGVLLTMYFLFLFIDATLRLN